MTQLRRFFAPPEQWTTETVVLDPEETHHLARVLRLSVGARVAVCDGRGRAAAAAVAAFESGKTVLHLEEDLSPVGESPLPLTLGLGLAKGEVMDQVVRQATEVGVTRFIPYTSLYSEKVTPEKAARRLARWQRQAREGLKSCQRLFLPEVSPLEDYARVLQGPEDKKLLFYEGERAGGLAAHLGSGHVEGVRILVGPEGGFSPEEVARAREAGFRVLSLGPRRLRVETAALAALTLVQYAWGDLG